MPEARSVTTGFYVTVGGRDESAELQGASHFLEHLLFKGTETRSAQQIASDIDAVGGEMNAYTAREHTVFYTRLPERELRLGLDILTEVITRPALRAQDVDAEREVILEELHMSEDDPDDVVHTQLWAALFPEHPVGREVLGTVDTIEAMSRDAIVDFHTEWYRPANLVIAAAGRLEHDDVLAGIGGVLEGGPTGTAPTRQAPSHQPQPRVISNRPTEGAHLALGWRALEHDHEARYAFAVANHVLGGGPSSRLFQEIREQRGLAYSVFSSTSPYTDCGAAMVYAGTSPSRVADVLEVIREVVADLVTKGITEDEHRVARGYLEGSLLLGLEDSGSRMARLANGEMVRGFVTPLDEHVARIQAVTRDEVQAVLQQVFAQAPTLAAVGPFEDDDAALNYSA